MSGHHHNKSTQKQKKKGHQNGRGGGGGRGRVNDNTTLRDSEGTSVNQCDAQEEISIPSLAPHTPPPSSPPNLNKKVMTATIEVTPENTLSAEEAAEVPVDIQFPDIYERVKTPQVEAKPGTTPLIIKEIEDDDDEKIVDEGIELSWRDVNVDACSNQSAFTSFPSLSLMGLSFMSTLANLKKGKGSCLIRIPSQHLDLLTSFILFLGMVADFFVACLRAGFSLFISCGFYIFITLPLASLRSCYNHVKKILFTTAINVLSSTPGSNIILKALNGHVQRHADSAST